MRIKQRNKKTSTSMPRIVQKNNSSSSSPTRSRVVAVKKNTPSESKIQMRSPSETKREVRNVRRIVPSRKPQNRKIKLKNKSKKNTTNQVDRLLKGMSEEMKNGIKEEEAAIAARKLRQEARREGAKRQEAAATDSAVDEKKRKKKVSIVVPGKNISTEDNTSTSPKKSAVPIHKVKAATTTSSTKQTPSKTSGRRSPANRKSPHLHPRIE